MQSIQQILDVLQHYGARSKQKVRTKPDTWMPASRAEDVGQELGENEARLQV